ncbi:MAG: hypothetical protein Fur0032_21750 [Terrimicrobiaceae bacterium]
MQDTITKGRGVGMATKRLTLVAIDKGGVGKSFFCLRLIEWLESSRVNFLAFDPDYSNSTLTRFYPKAEFLDIRHSENLDRIIVPFDEVDLVLVDGVGAQQKIFLDWIEDTDLLNARQALGMAITLVIIVEEDKDTVHQAGEAVRRIGNQVDWLVVKNQKLSPRNLIYEHSEARKELLRCGAREVVMPKMSDPLSLQLQLRSLTIDRALNERSFYLLDRQRLIKYGRFFAKELDTVKDILLP